MATCPLCCEEKPSSAFFTLSTCSHQNCKDCMVKWIEKAEVSGRSHAACPFCRMDMTDQETLAVLGRPFQPRVARDTTLAQDVQEELDELTLQWLEEQTQPCPGCGARIEKVQGGCDLMECLCGYRFCYLCGSHGADCSCTPSHHFFWDNVVGRAASRNAPPRACANEEGEIDLRHHLQKRKQKERRDKIRHQRKSQRARLAREVAELDDTMFSAKWLFCSAENGSRILHQLLRKESVKTSRIRRGHDQRREERMLDATLRSAKWLFCSQKGGLQMLKTQTSARVQLIQRRRARKKLLVEKEVGAVTETTMSAKWLFCPDTKKGQRILAEQLSRRAQKLRVERAENQKKTTKRVASGVSLAIENGSWLFQRKDPSKTVRQLARLLSHQTPLDHTVGLRDRMYALDALEWIDMASIRAEDETANAINIRLLFLDESNQKRELAEISLLGL